MVVTLTELSPGDTARVTGYRSHNGYTAQLMRLGLIPGTRITVQRTAPLGDPMEIRFRGFSLVLRPAEADDLMLERA